MDKDFREQLEHYKDNISLQFQLAGITEKTAPAYITKEMAIAIAANDWDTWQTLVGMACAIENQDTRATALNQLLLMPGHEFHQEVAFAIQCGAHPSSVSAIHKVLEQGFAIRGNRRRDALPIRENPSCPRLVYDSTTSSCKAARNGANRVFANS